MKKTLIALALACASSFAIAGPYDGVYQAAGVSDYIVVLQNGSTLGVAALGNIPTTGVQFNAPGGKLNPNSTNVWAVGTGPIVGNVATVTGTSDYGACTFAIRLTFDGAGKAVAAGLSATATAFGQSSGYNCAASTTLLTLNLSKIF